MLSSSILTALIFALQGVCAELDQFDNGLIGTAPGEIADNSDTFYKRQDNSYGASSGVIDAEARGKYNIALGLQRIQAEIRDAWDEENSKEPHFKDMRDHEA